MLALSFPCSPSYSFIHHWFWTREARSTFWYIDIDNRTICVCVYHGFNFGMCSFGRMLCVEGEVKRNTCHFWLLYIAMCGLNRKADAFGIRLPFEIFRLLPLQLYCFCCCIFFLNFIFSFIPFFSSHFWFVVLWVFFIWFSANRDSCSLVDNYHLSK